VDVEAQRRSCFCSKFLAVDLTRTASDPLAAQKFGGFATTCSK
jgi:hypothetical protein